MAGTGSAFSGLVDLLTFAASSPQKDPTESSRNSEDRNNQPSAPAITCALVFSAAWNLLASSSENFRWLSESPIVSEEAEIKLVCSEHSSVRPQKTLIASSNQLIVKKRQSVEPFRVLVGRGRISSD